MCLISAARLTDTTPRQVDKTSDYRKFATGQEGPENNSSRAAVSLENRGPGIPASRFVTFSLSAGCPLWSVTSLR
jgi:hypothetical protein